MRNLEIPEECRTINMKNPFLCVIREIMHGFATDLQITADAVTPLQEAAEAYLISIHKDANLYCIHERMVTFITKGILLAR